MKLESKTKFKTLRNSQKRNWLKKLKLPLG